jgi:drug/metabolite transporter (DMT)-like permease
MADQRPGAAETLAGNAPPLPSPDSGGRGPGNIRAGIAYRLASTLCFAVMVSQIKVAALAGVHIMELMFFRNLFALLTIVAMVAVMRRPAMLKTRKIHLHLTRTGIGAVSMVLIFTGLAALPLNDATAIGFSMPLFATILSVTLLGETIGRHRIMALVAGFAGVVIVAAPSGATTFQWAALYALGGSFVAALVMITVRQMGRTENGIAIAFYFALFTVPICALALPFVWTDPPADLWINLVVIGMSGGLAQIFANLSLRAAPVSAVAPFDYLQLLFVGLLAWLLFAETPTIRTLVGGLVIAGSGLYMLWRETRVTGRPLPAANADQNG